MGERKKGKKIWKKGKKRGKISIFVSLFKIGLYGRKLNREEFQKKSKGGGKIFLSGHNIYP